MKPSVPLYAVLRILGNRIEQSWKEPDERIFISTQEHFYIMSAADELSKLMEEREKLIAENEKLLESQETLWRALKDLHKTACLVSKYGARTGSQWVKMSGSLAIARIALASLEKSNG